MTRLSALSLANCLPIVLCGIVFFLSVGVGSAEDNADKGNIDAKSFRCITEMTHVRQFYVDNVLGNLDSTLAIANSPTGGTYPAGTIIQLVPTEAMVKRDEGFNPITHDWEFFERNGPRLHSDSAYARHEWRFAKNRSPLQVPDGQPQGCRSTAAASRSTKAAKRTREAF